MITKELYRIPIGMAMQVRELQDFGGQFSIEKTLYDHLYVNMRAYIYGEKLEQKEIKYPRDWWQMLKSQHAPAWFVKRYPIQYTTIKINAHACYPNFRPAINDKNAYVRVFVSPDLSLHPQDRWQAYKDMEEHGTI